MILNTLLFLLPCLPQANGEFEATYSFTGFRSNHFLGEGLSLADDIDGDGFQDFSFRAKLLPDYTLNGYYLISSRTGNKIWQIKPDSTYGSGGHMSLNQIGDLNQDGINDFAFSQGNYFKDYLSFYDGKTGVLLKNYHIGSSPSNWEGSAGDLSGDGVDEIVFQIRGYNSYGIIDFTGTSSYGDVLATAPNRNIYGIADDTRTGPTMVGDTSIPLSPDSLTYTMLLGMQPPFMDTNWRGTLDAQGDASFSFTPSPLLAPLVGLTLHHATVCLGTTNNVPVLSSVAWPLVIRP